MKILITGCAGFIGMHVAEILIKRNENVIGIDNLNEYYDKKLKIARLEILKKHKNFKFIHGDISDRLTVDNIFSNEQPSYVINLAAQAGVRYSIENPHSYIQSNLLGFGNLLESCRRNNVKHFVYASSSSVYGANTKIPFSVRDNVDHPVSLYAATKKANELMAHSYSHLYNLPTTGLRYFTVYGPWGRPDMSPWLFTSAIMEERPIEIFNNGMMKRDFTYVEDISYGTVKVLESIPSGQKNFNSDIPELGSSYAPYKIYNIGNNKPIELLEFIKIIEKNLGREAIKKYMPMQPGDVIATCADVDDIKLNIGFEAKTNIEDGLFAWIEWYKHWKKNY